MTGSRIHRELRCSQLQALLICLLLEFALTIDLDRRGDAVIERIRNERRLVLLVLADLAAEGHARKLLRAVVEGPRQRAARAVLKKFREIERASVQNSKISS